MTHKHTRRGQTQKNQVILNSIQDLQRLPLPLINNLRGRFQDPVLRHYGAGPTVMPRFEMTSLYNSGAFTLIELLVVVLIIGILAAVAVPQYQVAVEKSRVAPILSILKTLAEAQEVYYLENNSYATTLDELGVDIPGTTVQEISGVSYYTTPDGVLYMVQGQTVYGGTKLFQFNKNLPSKPNTGGKIACYAKADSYIAQRVCKSFGVTELKDTACGLITIGDSVDCKGGKMNF